MPSRPSLRPFATLTLPAALAALALVGQEPARTSELAAFAQSFCVECHGGAKPKGGVDLSTFTSESDFLADPDLLFGLREIVESGEMPPAKAEKQPEPEERAAAIAAAAGLLAQADAAAAGDPGEVVLRRLNRTQFRNTIRDLFGISHDPSRDLPDDPTADGFDSLGGGLWISPLLAEKYLDAVDTTLDVVFADPAARERLLAPANGAEDAAAARAVLAGILPRAFRRPATAAELDERLALHTAARARGADFAHALRPALAATLLSPHFLFRVEPERPTQAGGHARSLDAWEIATRLSYLLWSTMPDAQLFAAAADGSLLTADGRAAQIHRMRTDPRIRALSDDFFGQWLGFRGVLDLAVDIRKYPDFYGKDLRGPFYEEAALNCEALAREDRSILLLLDAPATFVNDRLAAHYGLPGVEGGQMREVTLPDRNRGGALGWGATLTISSFPLRTSPVLRGRWVLESLLADPPKPPPPEAGKLPEDDKVDDGQTPRARLERHRADPACASCHATMDPLGFALENFDGIGKWREADAGGPVDARGVLPDGTELAGVVGLKDALLARRQAFTRAAAERLFVYAVGRGSAYGDRALLDRIATDCLEQEGRFSALLLGIVESAPFLTRRASP
jgi:hypothetical protein